ncbi:hypothetical protein [Brevibacillus centrosporus]|uniref:hypothetical protein n=1 Tax=Brevibacillus centrosporus TaxID=54910 RepID=UPI00380A359B
MAKKLETAAVAIVKTDQKNRASVGRRRLCHQSTKGRELRQDRSAKTACGNRDEAENRFGYLAVYAERGD